MRKVTKVTKGDLVSETKAAGANASGGEGWGRGATRAERFGASTESRLADELLWRRAFEAKAAVVWLTVACGALWSGVPELVGRVSAQHPLGGSALSTAFLLTLSGSGAAWMGLLRSAEAISLWERRAALAGRAPTVWTMGDLTARMRLLAVLSDEDRARKKGLRAEGWSGRLLGALVRALFGRRGAGRTKGAEGKGPLVGARSGEGAPWGRLLAKLERGPLFATGSRNAFRVFEAEEAARVRRVAFGMGFRWEARHTMAAEALGRSPLGAVLLPEGAARLLCRAPRKDPESPGVGWIHGLVREDAPVTFPLANLGGGTLVVGVTQCGKGVVLTNLVTQAILRGDTVLVIDPKSSDRLRDAVFAAAKVAGRAAPKEFHPADPTRGVRLDPFGTAATPTEIGTRLVAAMGTQNGDFTNFARSAAETAAGALMALGIRPTLRGIRDVLTGGVEKTLGEMLARLTDPVVAADPVLAAWLAAVDPDAVRGAENRFGAGSPEVLRRLGFWEDFLKADAPMRPRGDGDGEGRAGRSDGGGKFGRDGRDGRAGRDPRKGRGERAAADARRRDALALVASGDAADLDEALLGCRDDAPGFGGCGAFGGFGEEAREAGADERAEPSADPTADPTADLLRRLRPLRRQRARDRSVAVLERALTQLLIVWRRDAAHWQKVTASLMTLLQQLTAGELESALSPDGALTEDLRPVVSLGDVLRGRGILYLGLNALRDRELAGSLGRLLLADLAALAGARYNAGESGKTVGRIELFVDEASNVANLPLIEIINKGLEAGINTTVVVQTLNDLKVALGSEAAARVVIGNMNNFVALRTLDDETQGLLSEKCGRAALARVTTSDTVTSNASGLGFSAATARRFDWADAEVVPPALFGRLPNLEAFVSLSGGSLFKVRFPIIESAVLERRHLSPEGTDLPEGTRAERLREAVSAFFDALRPGRATVETGWGARFWAALEARRDALRRVRTGEGPDGPSASEASVGKENLGSGQ